MNITVFRYVAFPMSINHSVPRNNTGFIHNDRPIKHLTMDYVQSSKCAFRLLDRTHGIKVGIISDFSENIVS